jgi:hypothetical protein
LIARGESLRAGQFRSAEHGAFGIIMRDLDVSQLLRLVAALETLGQENAGDWMRLNDTTRNTIKVAWPEFEEACRNSGLVTSQMSVAKIIQAGTAANAKWRDVTLLCRELKDRLVDETQSADISWSEPAGI